MDIRAIFAFNLRQQRMARDWSQEEVAHRAGVDRTYVSALERCLYSVSIEKLADLAQAFGIEPAALLALPPGFDLSSLVTNLDDAMTTSKQKQAPRRVTRRPG